MSKKLILLIALIPMTLRCYTQTAVWATPPIYQSLEEYAGNLYKIRENGKVGLIDISGKVVAPADYDSITAFIEHTALALDYENDKYAVKGIINQHHLSIISVNGTYYVTDKYPFFSEGKLVVLDKNNKYGYLQTNGSLFKDCQYLKAYPFYNGLACIQVGEKKIKYLKTNGEQLTTELESNTYTLLSGTSFNEKGEAFVQGEATGKGIKRCIIDTDGKQIREAKISGKSIKNYKIRKQLFQPTLPESDIALNGINPFLADKEYGFADNNGIVLPAQFTEALPFRGGYAKVKQEGKYGILQLQPGFFTGKLAKNKVKVINAKFEPINYTITTPLSYANKEIIMQMYQGKEMPQELSPTVSESCTRNYSFIPEAAKKEKEIYYRFSIQANGLRLWEDTQQISFQYVVQPTLLISAPQVGNNFKVDSDGYVRADRLNRVEVYSIVENKSAIPITLTITLHGKELGKESKTLSIAAGTTVRISSYINNVKERKQADITVETSTGVSKNSLIKIKPFI